MNRFARSLVAVLLAVGMTSAGLGAAFGTGGGTVKGGATGCCRDAV